MEAEKFVERAGVARATPRTEGVLSEAMPEVRRDGVPSIVLRGCRKVFVEALKLETLPSSGPELDPGRLLACEGGRIDPSDV